MIQVKTKNDSGRHIAGMFILRNFGIALLLCAMSLGAACEKKSGPSDATTRRYQVRGIVRGLPPDRRTIEVEHENIPGFMPSMTMPFSVRDEKEIAGLKMGDAISVQLNVTDRDAWIDQVRKIDRAEVQLVESRASPPPATKSARLHEGDQMPAFSLTNEVGEPVTMENFRGRPFILTFIFTRCPIPNFCPRMSNNFSELQNAIKNGTGVVATTRLLSITLDPQFDTPQVLKEYGGQLHADPAIWSFVTGDEKQIDELTHAFSVYRKSESGTISHGLATALVDANGTITKIWRGNGWTPAEVIEEIKRNEH